MPALIFSALYRQLFSLGKPITYDYLKDINNIHQMFYVFFITGAIQFSSAIEAICSRSFCYFRLRRRRNIFCLSLLFITFVSLAYCRFQCGRCKKKLTSEKEMWKHLAFVHYSELIIPELVSQISPFCLMECPILLSISWFLQINQPDL